MDLAPDLDPSDGEVLTEELYVNDDLLVKAFALGSGAGVDPHEHAEHTNAFHVLEGEVVVTQGEAEQRVSAPAVVVHDRGVVHGARNDTQETALFTATMGPMR